MPTFNNSNVSIPSWYIYYYEQDAIEKGNLDSIYDKIETAKDNIMHNYASRVRRMKSNFSMAGADRQTIEEMFGGKAFEKMAKTIPVNSNYDKLAFMSAPQAIAKLNYFDSDMSKVDNFCNKFNSGIGAYLTSNSAKIALQDYSAAVAEEFASGHKMSKDELATQVINSLLSRGNEKFFEVQGDKYGVNKAAMKIYTLVNYLPDADLSGTMIVKHGDEKSGTEVSGESAISDAIFEKYNNWVQFLNSKTAETSFAIGTLKVDKETIEAFEKATGIKYDNKAGGRGDISWSKNFEKDEEVEYLANLVKDAWKNMTRDKKVSKSDVGFSLNENGIEAWLGVNVKDYKNKISPNLKNYDFEIQSGTPLFTFLVREAGLYQDINKVYNLAAVHGNSSSLNKAWQDLIEAAGYRGLLDALMGIGSKEQSFYISLNGNLWTMGDFVYHIVTSNSTVNISEIIAKGEKSTGGLTRMAYVRRNQPLGNVSQEPDVGKALRRASRTQASITQLMYSTKIRVSIHLSQIANLFKYVI